MKRLRLAHLPTPLEHPGRLAQRLGVELWVKRDDASGGAEAGNKIRKLEFLLADALEQGADTVITCGGVQSNHARATAICAARLGLACTLLLRAPTLTEDDGGAGVEAAVEHAPVVGNVLLDRLVGADIRLITAASYVKREALLQVHAERLRQAGRRPYVIEEGGSSALGVFGYIEAMQEIRLQLDAGVADGHPFDLVVHACGSGGTAAGVALGAARYQVARQVCAMAVCDDAASFERRIGALIEQARRLDPQLGDAAPWQVDDRFRGPAYAQADLQQRQQLALVARLSGLVLDPVYTGKAFGGMWQLAERGELNGARRVLFLHTGGLPGLLAQGSQLQEVL